MPIGGEGAVGVELIDGILRDLLDAPPATDDALTGPVGEPCFPSRADAALHDDGCGPERCDEPGCQGCAVCGFPTVTGYRTTCAIHAVGWVGWRPSVDCRNQGDIS